jgi:hypothetical protein
LKAAFLVFPSSARYKEALVTDHMLFSNDTFQCNIAFIILVYDWKVEMRTLFFNLLYTIKMSRG